MQFNDWLDEAKKEEHPVVIKTITGEQTRGQIKWYDDYNICVENTNAETVFFKANVISLSPVER